MGETRVGPASELTPGAVPRGDRHRSPLMPRAVSLE